ncbi:family 16 glycosylhydrolase [Pseudonocardia humida]|uniref:Family 16 glycosylhydrolase n=1 Tax=Pseudonocardia humida TaxID=2800819 RepID=A0ABT1A8S6_9PSEU|nr:family 16 glycosylhydrolase [Pseudonocardia humida]MCO1659422.1 family 16 glycosylhydrolase [Pseudonocardia humida]
MRRNHSDAGGRTESSTELIARITAERQSRTSRSSGRHSADPAGTAAAPRSTERTSRHKVERPSRHAPEQSSEKTSRHHVAGVGATAAIPAAAARPALDTAAIPRVAPRPVVPAGRDVDATAVRRLPHRPADVEATAVRGAVTTADPAGTSVIAPVLDRDQVTEEISPHPIGLDTDEDTEDAEIEQDRVDTDEVADDAQDEVGARRRRRQAKSIGRRLAPLAVGAAVMLVATSVATFIQPPDEDQVAAPDLSSQFVNAPPVEPDVVADIPPAPVPQVPAPEVPAVTPVEEAAPEAPPEPVKPARNEGTTAANKFGWKLVERDEFDNGLGDGWANAYDGEGHNGNGRRVPEKVTVENGNLVIRGDEDGDTGGIAWDEGQEFGRWELRAKFPKGDKQYHPVLLLWPSAENWPVGGEVDFAETNSDADDVMFFLHYGEDNSQVFDRKQIDITQWHNYAVEWVDGRITGYIDGEKWFESTDDDQMPPGDMHLTVQLDYFPDEGDPEPSEMLVDFVRIYE